eukprot:7385097-Prymnesium_polylepis.2
MTPPCLLWPVSGLIWHTRGLIWQAIFVSSEDIREQLPEDAKRFDVIDAEFKEQMADASTMTNPIDACLKVRRR